MAEEALRVLIVDDHPIFRRGLVAQFEGTDITVVGQSDNGVDAVADAREANPSVVIVDLHLPARAGEKPSHCGTDVIRRILEHVPDAEVIVLSGHEEPERVREAFRAGASGYLLKDTKDVAQAVRTVADGMHVVDRRVMRKLVRHADPLADGDLPFGLTPAECRVAALMVQGLTNKEIAGRLGREPKTVQNTVSHVLTKLSVRTREEAIDIARANGIGREN